MKITKPFFGRSYLTTDFDYIPFFTLIPTLQISHYKDSGVYGFEFCFLLWSISFAFYTKKYGNNG